MNATEKTQLVYGVPYTEASPKHIIFRLITKSFSTKTSSTTRRNNWTQNFKVYNKIQKFTTRGEIDFIDLSERIQQEVNTSGIKNGIVHVFAPHATGVLILTENDEALLDDIKVFLEDLVSKQGNYEHPSNAHSHLRSILLPPDKTLPVIDGRVEFGTWQSLLFVETDVYPRERKIVIQVIGEQ